MVLARVRNEDQHDKSITGYVIIDDQSNAILGKSAVFEALNINSEHSIYNLSSCAGLSKIFARTAFGCTIEPIDGSTQLTIPRIIECETIPDVKNEIPTPEVALRHPHLRDIAASIPPLSDAKVILLIGRDVLDAHYVYDQRIGPRNTPYAQRLSLGWVIIGDVCLGNAHKPDFITVNKIYSYGFERPTIFKPCSNTLHIQSSTDSSVQKMDSIGNSVFNLTEDDEKVGMSIEDKEFLKLMESELTRDINGNWSGPLPFRSPRPRLPNNYYQAAQRFRTLDYSLKRNPLKMEHFKLFMQKILENKHAEPAAPIQAEEECWYLPIFGVYHPQKKDQILVVFDSSAETDGLSLNKVLLKGPDLGNSLMGVLLRFRKELVAVMADIPQMFYCFYVNETHRNFLQFLWYQDYDIDKPITEYHMCVHVFGNSPSPAVATFGLQRAALEGQQEFGSDVKDFVHRHFYVDDGLISLRTSDAAIDLIKRTQQALKLNGNIRLHKIASNCPRVVEAFPPEDRAKDLKNFNLDIDQPLLQRSLGLENLSSRDIMEYPLEWDEPIPEKDLKDWEIWHNSLKFLDRLQIPRTYSADLVDIERREIHIYSDASVKAISAVAYLKTISKKRHHHVGFIFGKAKVEPSHGHTIPRLELCAAVLAVEVSDLLLDHLDMDVDSVQYHTDSKVVLGYINNKTRRFYIYVENRVERIRKSSSPSQWSYIPSDQNPADQGTRSVVATEMMESVWLNGPRHLLEDNNFIPEITLFPLINPDDDQEIRPQVMVLATRTQKAQSRNTSI